MSESDIVLTAMARTPFGRLGGVLLSVDGPALGTLAIDETIRRAGIPTAAVDSVYAGVGMIGSAVLTPVRQAVLRSSLPQSTPSAAIDRACCSGMTALGFAFRDLRLGEARAILFGGFESLSNTPLLLPRWRPSLVGSQVAEDPLVLGGAAVDKPIAVYSGEEALRHGVDRHQQDEWALQSHSRYFAAQDRGFFDAERFGFDVRSGRGEIRHVAEDESPRRDSNLDKLARLKPVYGGPTVTAGNAPGLNDGAAFMLACSRAFAREFGMEPLARVVDYVQVCGGPTSGTTTPALAIQTLAKRQAFDPAALDLLEINEAYAATPLVSTLVLAGGDPMVAGRLRERTNVHGGAVAIGHPLGASGARIVMTLVNGLRQRGGGRGAAAICGGFGQGDAILVEV